MPLKTRARMNRWWIVVGSEFGLFFSNGPLLQFAFGAFLKPVSETFRVDRGTVSIALFVSLCGSALTIPLVGRLVDRLGVKRVAAPLVTFFAVAIAGIGLSRSLVMYIFWYGVAGIIGAGQTPLIYAKAIASAFDMNRGLALGIAMAGVGAGAAVVPKLAQTLVLHLGWQHAYVALGAITFLIAVPPVACCFRDIPLTQRVDRSTPTGPIGNSGVFWKMAGSFFVVALACSGVVAHLVPILTDRGIANQTAALVIGSVGLALIVGRLVSGYALDLFYAPYVAVCFFVMPFFGVLTLMFFTGLASAVAGSVLVGMGLGAEIDLIAYLQSRYLGLHRFAEIYGYLLMVFTFGAAIGPFAMGISFKYTGNYDAALGAFALALIPACLVLLTFGAYRFQTADLMPSGAGASTP
jgi:MFS family permease